MTTRIENLNELSVSDVQQEVSLLSQLLQEAAPTIDVRRGVLHDLLLQYSGILATKNQVEQDRLRQSMSVAAILADPTLADDEVVDNIASNYRVERQPGANAGGAVTVVVDTLRDLTIAVGSVFDAQGKGFVTEQVFTGRTLAESVVSSTDKLMVSRGDGTYSFQITVVAEEAGKESQLVKDTTIVPRILPLGFVIAFAAEDFIGGLSEESNKDLVDRFAFGLTAKSMADRSSMSATLREVFTGIVHDSIVGYGDAEMLRDRHSILPISLGGRADWYVQAQSLYRNYGVTKAAVLVEKTSDGFGIWQLTFDRDEYPGLYLVRVKPAEVEEVAGEFEVTELLRDFDITAVDSNDGFVPDIVNATEAAFTRFQTVIVKFKDTLTSTTGLTVSEDSKDYDVSVLAMPLIAEMQDHVSQRSIRSVAGDILIKAPMPVILNFACKLQILPGQTEPSSDNIADSLVSFVNSYGFLGRLPSSALLDVIYNHLESGASITDVSMIAKVYYPDGASRWLSDNELLEIPFAPASMLTSRTALFFLDPTDISISISTADVLAVV